MFWAAILNFKPFVDTTEAQVKVKKDNQSSVKEKKKTTKSLIHFKRKDKN